MKKIIHVSNSIPLAAPINEWAVVDKNGDVCSDGYLEYHEALAVVYSSDIDEPETAPHRVMGFYENQQPVLASDPATQISVVTLTHDSFGQVVSVNTAAGWAELYEVMNPQHMRELNDPEEFTGICTIEISVMTVGEFRAIVEAVS